MKIIKVDNFDREGLIGNDILIAENVNEYWGNKIVNKLNESEFSEYFKLVTDDYKLKRFEP